MVKTLILDLGNYGGRTVYEIDGELETDSFSSVVTRFKDLEDQKKMLDIEFLGNKFLTGEGVENFFEGKKDRMYLGGTKKGHAEGAIRLLHALYRVTKKTGDTEFNIVILSPYKSIQKDEDFFKEHFSGSNSYVINGKPYNFTIHNLGFAAEGLGAFNYATKKNVVLFDVGSGTWNVITMRGGVIQRDETFTVNGGTIGNAPFDIASDFQKLMKNLDYDYEIVVSGGKANEIASSLELLGYENVIVPEIEDGKFYFINAIGLYKQHYKLFLKKWNDS